MSRPSARGDRWPAMPPWFLWVAAVLCNLLAGCLGIATDHFEVPLHQFLLGSDELLRLHRIGSTFLPVGYPVLLAAAFEVGRASHMGEHAGFYVLNLLLSVGCLVLSYGVLRICQVRERPALLIALLVSVYPELLHNLSKVSDTNVTAVLLLGWVAAVMHLLQHGTARAAAIIGLVLGAAVLVRPNLALLVLLPVLLFGRWPAGQASRLFLVCLSIAVLFYGGVTAGVHGRPFFPENGPYNMFAGSNEYTGDALRTHQNGEASLVRAMEARGVHVGMNWQVQSDLPGQADARDLRYKPLYQREAAKFWREHPGRMLELAGLKFWTFLAPETNRYGFGSPKTATVVLWLVQKCISALIVPAWLMLLLLQCRMGLGRGNWVVVGTVLLYTLPFVAVNSDPRFRMPLAVLLMLDSGRLLLALRSREFPKRYFTSAPRPAA